jgi:hypothetical protein
MDRVLNILLSLIMLFNPEVEAKLEDKPAIERIQTAFLRVLKRYMQDAYPEVNVRIDVARWYQNFIALSPF